MITKKLATLLAASALVAGAFQAQAAPITGTIDIVASGSHVVLDKTANSVTFVDDNAVPGNALVSNGTGDFAAFVTQLVTYADFTYSPLAVANPIWTLVAGGLSFDLETVTFISEAGTGLVLNGTGTIHSALHEDTSGTWSFSADTASGGNFTFSSQTAANVPDGGATAMLLGLGVLGMATLRRKLS